MRVNKLFLRTMIRRSIPGSHLVGFCTRVAKLEQVDWRVICHFKQVFSDVVPLLIGWYYAGSHLREILRGAKSTRAGIECPSVSEKEN